MPLRESYLEDLPLLRAGEGIAGGSLRLGGGIPAREPTEVRDPRPEDTDPLLGSATAAALLLEDITPTA